MLYTYYYEFTDGYSCLTFGKMDRCQLKHEIYNHGNLVIMRRV